MKIVVVGGGAAGFFGSIAAAQNYPQANVILLEKSKQLLSKVRISGGGRCNVTHACFDPKQLIQNYPRGHKELLGPFFRFQPLNTIEWFKIRGVLLKTEEDGRMFPITDSSETIIHCLINEAKRHKVEIRTETGVNDIIPHADGFDLSLHNGSSLACQRLLIASGSNAKTWDLLVKLGHTIVSPIPSLFTFNVPSSPLLELAGISMPKVHLTIKNSPFEQTGPLLITHWGFSGPAVLKLSAWGARWLHEKNYKATLEINWLPNFSKEEVKELLVQFKKQFPSRLVINEGPTEFPRNLWKKFVEAAEITPTLRWAHLSAVQSNALLKILTEHQFDIEGKTTYKEEFVTSGGVALNEVHFKTMQSKLYSRLYFAGETLDIDGVTGGFNFQNAWTTAFIAGNSMGAT